MVGDEEVSVITEQITWGTSDYLFVTTAKTWAAAGTYCAQYDGGSGYHLVTIDDEKEEAFLNTAEAARGKSNWWIGYSDAGVEGTWGWSSGSSFYTNWKTGQPDNYNNQDCAVDRNGGTDYWADIGCGVNNVFICERDSLPSTNRGSAFYSRSNTNNATTNTYQLAVPLFAGQLFTVGTCGVPESYVMEGNTWLRVTNPSGVEIGSNNDSGGDCGTGSNISIVIATSGTHVIRAGCYANTACSAMFAYNY